MTRANPASSAAAERRRGHRRRGRRRRIGAEGDRAAEAKGAVRRHSDGPHDAGDVRRPGRRAHPRRHRADPAENVCLSIGACPTSGKPGPPDAFLTNRCGHQCQQCIAELAGAAEPDPVLQLAAEPPRPATQAGRGRILLAEDNETNTLLACTILEEAGFSVACAVNGVEAVEGSNATFDLVLMDADAGDGRPEATCAIRRLAGRRPSR